ncbi:MAG: ComEC/Rec2 family competence protein [Pseudomonadota bacterium]
MTKTSQREQRRNPRGATIEVAEAPIDERFAFRVPNRTRTPLAPEKPLAPSARPQPATRPLIVTLNDTRTLLARAAVDEVEYGTLFLIIPVCLIAGCALYFALPTEPAVHQLPLMCAAVAVIARLVRKYTMLCRALLAVLFCVFGALLAQWHTSRASTPMMGSAVVTTLTGTVLDVERRPGGAARYTVRIETTERPRLRHAPEIVRISSRTENPNIVPGAMLRATTQLRAASGPVRPGAYDFAFQAYFAGYGANGFSYGMPERVAPPATWREGGLARLRLALANRIVAHAPDRPASAIAGALIAGKKGRIPEDVTEALRVTGLAHILAISGLHMALVAGTVMVFVRLMLSWDQAVAARRQTKKWAAMAALTVATGYLLLAGASIATQRSYIMLTVMLIALCLDRPAVTKRNLAIAAIIIVLLQPHAVVSPGFHMSFAATLALIGCFDWINRRRDRRVGAEPVKRHPLIAILFKGIKIMLAVALTSIIAGLATGIFSAYHFHRVAPLSLPANIAAMPIVTFITMPSALVSVAAIPFGLDGFTFAIMFASIDAVTAIAAYFADASPSGQIAAMSRARLVLLTLALLFFCVPRTGIRFVALGVMVLALLPFTAKPSPAIRISEDARQVALITKGRDRSLSVNRARPSRFIIDQWAFADAVPLENIVKPAPNGQDPALRQFSCADGVCVASMNQANAPPVTLAVVENPGQHDGLCERTTIIVEAYAPARIKCAPDQAQIITAQQLALKGAAEVHIRGLTGPSGDTSNVLRPEITVQHALSDNLRPWHSHRVYGRSARNLPPYERRKTQ